MGSYTVTTCDLCETKEDLFDKQKRLQVIFHTEQNEGRASDPYLNFNDLDICKNCFGRVLNGEAIHATGAMGYNTYYFEQ